MRPNGRDIRRVTPRGIGSLAPTWSPNGRWISYERTGRRPGLYRARLDGSRERRMTRNRNDQRAGWGPRPRR